ncbi:erythroblast NAD(P)(+)--arginine ADP-ribosyltransferase-like [Hirundo rustica]|uniref:erythroblast NAD(P)(+)--arginine ADP-ribosyltransferase-like n=1 Tax=Hirundo rustica TaxID=43150 RepID=UPI0026721C8B|nr:erythroblast NAD(P)(+)--arginine ADP-ribosyltransferase-like [Hirundo rustica]
MTVATVTTTVVALDMALDSFDDQYRGCRHAMTQLLPALEHSEFQKNPQLARLWVEAAERWQRRGPPVTPLSPAQAIALMTYTTKDVSKEFNAAVRVAGRSRREYRHNFHFKALHFLLTDALATLRDARGPRCHHVFRGVRGLRFQARPGDTVRFGRFTSTSLRKEIAQQFGTDTVFQVQTCHGVDIREFSSSPGEEEVLIPPFETFRITGVSQEGDRAQIQLRSTGTFSKYSCEWLRPGSIPRAPSHPRGLLLATTALAVATRIIRATGQPSVHYGHREATVATTVAMVTVATLAILATTVTITTRATVVTKTPGVTRPPQPR